MAAACVPTAGTAPPVSPLSPVAPAAGDHIGSGSIKVALILPQSGPGNAPLVAASLRNAAVLALRETPGADLDIIVKDDKGTQEGGRAAAVAAIGEGAELILGPLFAPSVRGAAEVARPAGVPIIAFSTDANVAARGVYLFGFLPEGDAARITAFAASRGKRSLAALLPDNGYGAVFGGGLQRAAAANGSTVASIERYAPGDAAALAARTAALASLAAAGSVAAIAAPAGDDAPLRMGAALAAQPQAAGRVQMLGSGQWDDPRLLTAPALAGGWFPAPEKSGYEAFAGRYAAAFGAPPQRTAALAFDATRLAAGLAARFGERRFAFETLTNPNGFSGVDGAFRLLPDGLNQRSLAVYEISGGTARVIDPAPTRFPTAPVL